MEHVLWIGGPPRAGKSTVAAGLARRHGLRLYRADAMTWVHLDRAIAAGVPAAIEWEAMTPSERWERSTPEQMLERSFLAERGQMVIEDLAALPTDPLVVAEGVALPPSAVRSGLAPRDVALWLVPTAEFQDRRLEETEANPARRRLARLLREVIGRQAAECGAPTLVIDGTRGPDATLALLEERFAGALGRGPRAETTGARAALAREVNLATVDQVRGYWARPWADGDPEAAHSTFWCECGGWDCTSELRRSIAEVAAGPLLAPGHRDPGGRT